MVLALFAPPGVEGMRGDTMSAAIALSVIIWLFFCGLRPSVQVHVAWSKAGEEPMWIAGHGIVLYIFTPIYLMDIASNASNLEFLQYDGSTLKCPSGLALFLLGWSRAWVFVYLNQGVRDAFVTLLVVLSKLGPFFAFSGCIFLIFFFMFQGYAYHFGVVVNEFGAGGSVGGAFFNLFGLMTTVNHPDQFVYMVDQDWFVMVLIMAYIFSILIVAQNLLLGVVYAEYCNALDTKLKYKAKLRAAMLDTAFDLIIQNREVNDITGGASDYLNPVELLHILRQCDDEETPLDLEDGDRLQMIVRLIDNKATSRSEIKDNKNLQDGRIDRADFHELQVFYNCPLVLKTLKKTSHRYHLRLEQLESQMNTSFQQGHEKGAAYHKREIEELCKMDPQTWAATFPSFYHAAQEWGSNQAFMSWSPWFHKSAIKQFHVT